MVVCYESLDTPSQILCISFLQGRALSDKLNFSAGTGSTALGRMDQAASSITSGWRATSESFVRSGDAINVCSFIIQSRRALQPDWRAGRTPLSVGQYSHDFCKTLGFFLHDFSYFNFFCLPQPPPAPPARADFIYESSLSVSLPSFPYLTGLRKALRLLRNFLCLGGTLDATPRNCLFGGRLLS